MSDIQSLIQELQSKNPDKRYDACEELRVIVLHEPLPQEAIDALQFAANDSNTDVADAAQRALALHAQQSTADEVVEKEQDKAITVKYWPLIGFLAGLIPGLVLFFLFRDAPAISLYTICIGSVGITCGMIGAYIGKRSNKAAWIIAILVAILGAGLSFALAIFSCVFCM